MTTRIIATAALTHILDSVLGLPADSHIHGSLQDAAVGDIIDRYTAIAVFDWTLIGVWYMVCLRSGLRRRRGVTTVHLSFIVSVCLGCA